MHRSCLGVAVSVAGFTLFFLIGAVSRFYVQAAEPAFQKGMCYAAWEKDRYASKNSDKALEKLSQTGTEWVQIVTTYYQETYNSTKIFPGQKTPSDKSLIHAIKQAKSLGMKVMLKPHIDLIDESNGLYRADIGFQNEADWQAWFSQYRDFILHYARLAEKTGVDLFCVGTELAFASAKASYWQEDIIPKVRQAYLGEITYAANWDEYQKVGFWRDLDYVGIDAYFPLSQKKSPEYEEIKAGWIKWAYEIQRWQEAVGKPIIFTEIGYRSCEFAATRPWEYSLGSEVHLEIQEACYKAALEVLSAYDWCKGLYWWYWKPSPYAGGPSNRDFIPQNKPAEIVLTSWYKGLLLAGM